MTNAIQAIGIGYLFNIILWGGLMAAGFFLAEWDYRVPRGVRTVSLAAYMIPFGFPALVIVVGGAVLLRDYVRVSIGYIVRGDFNG